MYQLQQKVLFQHCDPAGIVFYPRYFEMINATVEQWFSDELDYSFAQMHVHDKVGVPTAAIDTVFKAPSRLEDWLDFSLQLLTIGQKSADLRIDIHSEGELRVIVKMTLVFVDLAGERPFSKPWPEVLRQKMKSFVSNVT